MRDVNNGWLVRYLHSNTASAFFFLVGYCVFSYYFYFNPVNVYWYESYNSLNSNTHNLFIDNLEKTDNQGLGNNNPSSIPNQKKPLDSFPDKNFEEWFVGFTDAEGSFFIQTIDNRFKFIFNLCLHIDEYPLLDFVTRKLGVGNIQVRDSSVNYTVSSKDDLIKIFSILDKRSLNTSKHFNYMLFRKAYSLYFNRETNKVSIELREKLLELKNQMNKNKVDLNEERDIIITHYWLLGFVEGDGYFSVNPKTCSLKFGIGQTSQEIAVLEAIKNFLLNLPGEYSIKRSNTNLVKVETYNQAKGRDNRPMAYLTVNQTDYLTNVLVPLFDSLIWLSKKEKDYQDWRLILDILKQGKHFTDEGKELITLIAKNMNNNRLSTNLASKMCSSETIQERALKLLESPSNYEIQPDGKILIKSTGTYFKGRGNVSVKALGESDELVYKFSSILECAQFFGVHSRTINRKLDNGNYIEFKGKNLVLKRELSI